MKGKLIAFEGIDGTGKSTQLQFLAAFLRERGRRVLETKEPTDGLIGKKIRSLFHNRQSLSLDEELELFIEDRRLHVEQCIVPALEEGTFVLTDRYYYSTAAYQGARGADPQEVFRKNRFAPVPDLVLLFTMSCEESVRRIEKLRREALNDFEQKEQLSRVAELFASFTDPAIVHVDAARPLEVVRQDIISIVSNRFDL